MVTVQLRGVKKGTHLVVFVLKLGLGTLRARADSLGVVAVKGATGLSVEQLGAVLVEASDEKGNAERTAHDGLFTVGTLAEAQGKVADSLGAALDTKGLVVVEGVGLALDTGMLNHGAGVGLEARHGAANVTVDLNNLLDGRGLEEGRGDTLLNTENDTLRGGDADGRGAELDGLEGVFDLEETAFGGEGVDSPVWQRLALIWEVNDDREKRGKGRHAVFGSCHKHLGGCDGRLVAREGGERARGGADARWKTGVEVGGRACVEELARW